MKCSLIYLHFIYNLVFIESNALLCLATLHIATVLNKRQQYQNIHINVFIMNSAVKQQRKEK